METAVVKSNQKSRQPTKSCGYFALYLFLVVASVVASLYFIIFSCDSCAANYAAGHKKSFDHVLKHNDTFNCDPYKNDQPINIKVDWVCNSRTERGFVIFPLVFLGNVGYLGLSYLLDFIVQAVSRRLSFIPLKKDKKGLSQTIKGAGVALAGVLGVFGLPLAIILLFLQNAYCKHQGSIAGKEDACSDLDCPDLKNYYKNDYPAYFPPNIILGGLFVLSALALFVVKTPLNFLLVRHLPKLWRYVFPKETGSEKLLDCEKEYRNPMYQAITSATT